MNELGNGLLAAVGIGLLIFVHELGHFLAARWIGARVEVFSLGFGPRLCGFRRGPTDYRLSLIPLGGYVAVAGQDPLDHRHPSSQSLAHKTVGQRALFFCGGVVMNLLFALIAFPIAFHSGVSFPAPQVGHVEPGSPAWEAGLQPGDRIRAIDGKETYAFDNLFVEAALAGGRMVTLLVERDGRTLVIEARPQFHADAGLFVLGIEPSGTGEPPTLQVDADGAAERAGVRSGDRLLSIDGRAVRDAAAMSADPAQPAPEGASQVLVVERDGRPFELVVQPSTAKTRSHPQIGVLPMANRVRGLRRGLPALDTLGLARGDVLVGIDGAPFVGQDLATPSVRDDLELRVRRDDRDLTLRAPFAPADRQALPEHLALVADHEDTVIAPVADGPAAAAGLLAGDRIVRIEGEAVRRWLELPDRIRGHGERPMRIEVERQGVPGTTPATVTLAVTPRARPVFDYGYAAVFEQLRTRVEASGVFDALRLGTVCALDLTKQLYVMLKRLLTGEVAAKNLGGIIQISRTSYHNTQAGLPRFLYFLALLSINLAFINVLPIPVLDGGHLLFLLIEKVKGSPVSTNILNYSQVLGLVLVLALVVFVTYNDILRLL